MSMGLSSGPSVFAYEKRLVAFPNHLLAFLSLVGQNRRGTGIRGGSVGARESSFPHEKSMDRVSYAAWVKPSFVASSFFAEVSPFISQADLGCAKTRWDRRHRLPGNGDPDGEVSPSSGGFLAISGISSWLRLA